MKSNQGCCHCEPARVWQSMENKKTTTKTKRMKNNQDTVTANPLGCGSLWKIKNNNGNGGGLPRPSEVCHFLEQKRTSKNNFSDGEKFF